VFARIRQFHGNENGSTIMEFTIGMMTFFLVLFGVIEFTYGYYQWNSASKAVQLGARIAAVSDPITPGLRTWTGVTNSILPGDPMPAFDVTCQMNGATVTCTGSPGDVTAAPSAAAFQDIVYGRGNATSPRTCVNPPASPRNTGMCNIFNRINSDNIFVRYQNTGLGYAGRPGGTVPTITVGLRGDNAGRLTYTYIFIGTLMNFAPVTLPTFSTTVTGEDLNLAAPL
jgi:Flp pilus assembly protein TadG